MVGSETNDSAQSHFEMFVFAVLASDTFFCALSRSFSFHLIDLLRISCEQGGIVTLNTTTNQIRQILSPDECLYSKRIVRDSQEATSYILCSGRGIVKYNDSVGGNGTDLLSSSSCRTPSGLYRNKLNGDLWIWCYDVGLIRYSMKGEQEVAIESPTACPGLADLVADEQIGAIYLASEWGRV